jgi:hypothetical protein
VSGKNRTTFKQMVRMDIGYAKQRGFLLDLLIFLKTIPAIVAQVAGRSPAIGVQPKRLSPAMRTGAVLLALHSLNSFQK